MAHSRICSVPDCGKRHLAKGFCGKHWTANRLYGDPLGKAPSYSQQLKWLNSNSASSTDECIKWPFAILPDGYAHAHFRGVSMKASRAMCIVAHGEPPTDKHETAHSCGRGNQGCVNPRHLRWATKQENEKDKVAHGTSNRGERSAHAKLNEDDVRAIRSMSATMTDRGIAKIFGITHSSVQSIRNRKTWSHLA
jgi:hypothetical protein